MMINLQLSRFNAGWVVGFVESEGVFTVNSVKIRRKTKLGFKNYRYLNPAFYLVSNNKDALEIVRGFLGMGKINKHGSIFHLDIRSKGNTMVLAALLDGKLKSSLRARQFEVWKSKVLEWKTRAWGTGLVDGGKGESPA